MQAGLKSPYKFLKEVFENSSSFFHHLINYFKQHFLLKGEIRWGDETKTAAITFEGRKPVIILNKNFVKSIKREEDLIFVLVHEVMHYIRGDLFRERDFKDFNILNLAADILVNRDVYYHVFRFEPEFLWEFLKPEKDPFSLLRMPPWMIDNSGDTYWNKTKEKLFIKAIKNFGKKPCEWIYEFAKIYNLLQTGGMTLSELYEFIVKFLGGRKYIFIPISGLQNCKRKKGRIHLPFPSARAWIDRGGLRKEKENKKKIKITKILKIARELREIIYYSDDDYSKIERMIKSSGVLPFPSRKEIFLLSRGVFPLFYPNYHYTKIMHNEKLHIYLDVSGSMKEELPYILFFLFSIKDLWGKKLKGFSTELVDLSLKDIEKGIFYTTGGTDLNIPLIDAIENRKKRILIITDLLGRPSQKVINTVKQNNIKVYILLFKTKLNPRIPRSELKIWDNIIEKKWVFEI